MKKILIIISLLIFTAIIFRVTTFQKFNSTGKLNIKTEIKSDPKNASYLIDGQLITLVDGLSIIDGGPDSVSKITTRYFGNEAVADLNNDGVDDLALILTQDTGGSGNFYYVTAALKTDSGYTGLNAILLGDRIAPESTEINDGKITLNYADRKLDEPMTAAPSVGVSRYFKVANNLLEEIKN